MPAPLAMHMVIALFKKTTQANYTHNSRFVLAVLCVMPHSLSIKQKKQILTKTLSLLQLGATSVSDRYTASRYAREDALP